MATLPAYWQSVAITALLALWTFIVRAPFAANFDNDEVFFSVVASRWLHGELPYNTSFDVKPPGIFAIYALAQGVFGSSLAVLKGLEMAFVATGAALLFRLVSPTAGRPAALWCAFLYPVLSLTQQGVNVPTALIQAPFIILAFDTLMRARTHPRMRSFFLIGMMIGMAGMIKQTALFEALALFVWIVAGFKGRIRLSGMACFIAGTTFVPLLFCAYFAANGGLKPAIDASVVYAAGRTAGDAITVNAAGTATTLSLWQGLAQFFPLSRSLIVFWLMAALAITRSRSLPPSPQRDLIFVAASWLIAAGIGVVSVKSMYLHYALPLIAPLLILSGIFVFHLLAWPKALRRLGLAGSGLAAGLTALILSQDTLKHSQIDVTASRKTAAYIQALGLREDDRILALQRGLMVNVLSHHMPSGAYIHDQHLLCPLALPDAAPWRLALAEKPQIIVMGDPKIRMMCTDPARLKEISEHLDHNYDFIARVKGTWDSYDIYRRKPSAT